MKQLHVVGILIFLTGVLALNGCVVAPVEPAELPPTTSPESVPTSIPVEIPTAEPNSAPAAELANPAAVFCEENGYDYQIQNEADGSQAGVCVFDDGSTCDGWAYFRGECGPDTAEASETEDQLFTETDYQFSFLYPTAWSLSQDSGGQEVAGGHAPRTISLRQDNLLLQIQYQRPGENSILGPGGRPAGEIDEIGEVMVNGEWHTKYGLVYQERLKSVFLGVEMPGLILYFQLDGEIGPDDSYEEIKISDLAQDDMDRILESLTMLESTVSEGPSDQNQVIGWLGYVLSSPAGSQFDDYLVLMPEGAGEIDLSGETEAVEAEIIALRDKEEPGKMAHFWGILQCDMPDHGNCQLLVTRVRSGATCTKPETVEAWTGYLMANPEGMQFDDYFVFVGDWPVGYGINSLDPELQAHLESSRNSGQLITVWGQLRTGVPDAFGSQIEVTAIEY